MYCKERGGLYVIYHIFLNQDRLRYSHSVAGVDDKEDIINHFLFSERNTPVYHITKTDSGRETLENLF